MKLLTTFFLKSILLPLWAWQVKCNLVQLYLRRGTNLYSWYLQNSAPKHLIWINSTMRQRKNMYFWLWVERSLLPAKKNVLPVVTGKGLVIIGLHYRILLNWFCWGFFCFFLRHEGGETYSAANDEESAIITNNLAAFLFNNTVLWLFSSYNLNSSNSKRRLNTKSTI